MTASVPTHPDGAPTRTALITGSAAPFAQRLVDRLESLGWRVSTVVHDSPELAPPTHAIHVLAPEPRALATAVQDVDAVILLSGIDSLTSMVDDSQDLDAVLGDLRPGSVLVEVTTMAVFGDTAHPVTEADAPAVPAALDPVAACEIRVLAAEDWLRGIVVRPGLVYGDGGGLALAPAVELARAGGTSRYFGDGDEILPTVHEDELIDLLAQVVTDPSSRGVYHATSGSVTARELAELVATAAGVETVEPWTEETMHAELGTTSAPPRVSVRTANDVVRATTELGWRPTAPSLAQSLLG